MATLKLKTSPPTQILHNQTEPNQVKAAAQVEKTTMVMLQDQYVPGLNMGERNFSDLQECVENL